MKKLILLGIIFFSTIVVKANPIQHFTHGQAIRVVNFLQMQPDLLIYCGYAREQATYIVTTDVWIERLNPTYYEVWIYGYEPYTDEVIAMPIDLSCIWYNDRGNASNVARRLGFNCDIYRPRIAWAMPSHRHYPRTPRPVVVTCTYHRDMHCRTNNHTTTNHHINQTSVRTSERTSTQQRHSSRQQSVQSGRGQQTTTRNNNNATRVQDNHSSSRGGKDKGSDRTGGN